jgi:Ca2+-binding EF-hand superfamily protein
MTRSQQTPNRITLKGSLLKITAATVVVIAGTGLAAVFASEGQENFRSHFMTSWDADGDGQVTMDEARERRESIFLSFDSNENGTLDDGELAMMDEMRASQHADMEGKGHGMDLSGGMGKRTGGGMNHGTGHGKAGSMGGFQKAAEAGLHGRRGVDANGDGVISKEEFVGMTEAWFVRLDANSDGIITKADF